MLCKNQIAEIMSRKQQKLTTAIIMNNIIDC